MGAIGVPLGQKFVDQLPDDVDPCGEFGEYHPFTFAGPLFQWPIELPLSMPYQIHAVSARTPDPNHGRFAHLPLLAGNAANLVGRFDAEVAGDDRCLYTVA